MSSARSIFQPTKSYGSLTGTPSIAPVPLLSVNDTGENGEVVLVVSEPEIHNNIQIPSDVFPYFDIESLIAVNKINKQSHSLVVDRVKVLKQLQMKPLALHPLRRLETRKNPISRLDNIFKKISNSSIRLQAQILKNAIHYIKKNIFTFPAEHRLLPSSPVDLILQPEVAVEEKPTEYVIGMFLIPHPVRDNACIEDLELFGAAIRDILSVYKKIDVKMHNAAVARNIKNLFMLKLKKKYFYLQYSIGFDVTAGGVDIKNVMDCLLQTLEMRSQQRKSWAFVGAISVLALAAFLLIDLVPMNKLMALCLFLIVLITLLTSAEQHRQILLEQPDTDAPRETYLNRNLLFTTEGNQRLIRLINEATPNTTLTVAEPKHDNPTGPRPT